MAPPAQDVEVFLIAASLCLTVAAHLAVAIRFPRPLRRFGRWLRAPFRNFLTLEDLDGPFELALTPTLNSRLLLTLSLLQCGIGLAAAVHKFVSTEIEQGAFTVPGLLPGVAFISWGYFLLRFTAKPPATVPYLFTLYSSIFAGVHIAHIIQHPRASDVGVFVVQAILAAICVYVSGTYPLNSVRPCTSVARPTDEPSSNFSSPEDDITLWEWCTFSFVVPLLRVASKHRLNEPDVWSLPPYFLHKNLFNKYLEYQNRHPNHSLLRFLLTSNSLDLILDIMLELWSAVVGFLPPFALQRILSALSEDNPDPNGKSTAYFWSFIIFVAHLSFAQMDLFQAWHTRRAYERTRGQLFCALHYKALKRQDVSGKVDDAVGDSGADLGKIVNLMQGDAYAVAQRFWEFSGIFAAPVRLTIAMIFLYNILGWSALIGVAIVLVAYVLNYPLAKYSIHVTRSMWKAKDSRMNVVNELLQNIRFLKFYGWENHWARKSHDARENELRWRVKENVVDTGISFIWTWIPSATALLTFLSYTLIAGERLTVAKAFTSIALFSQLQGPMTQLPDQVFAMLHAYVSMQRIEQFLGEDEVPDWACTLTSPLPKPAETTGFSMAVFEFQAPPKTSIPGTPRFRLGALEISFPRGKLSLVSGATGSGKSALLLALLGEMHCISGHVNVDKSSHHVAYCGQNAWLEHATIRENIVYKSRLGYDESRYKAVIDACALKRDLEVFSAGDLTEVGERGITLSGGQRARLALARAIYSEAELVLLDDPLAAVDMHTAQHIVSKCLASKLLAKGRTIILVTHHIGLCLPVSSYLVELAHGQVLRQGSIQSLREKGLLQKAIEDEKKYDTFAETEDIPDIPAGEADPLQRGDPSTGKLIEAEARAEGRVSMRTYLTYIRAAGTWCWVFSVLLMLCIRMINVASQTFLAKWGEAYQNNYPTRQSLYLDPLSASGFTFLDLPSPDSDVRPWLMIYMWISVAGAFSVLFYIALGYYASLQASRTLFERLLIRISRAPSRFFDITPIGRILNRFTSDINTIDGALQNSARATLMGVFNFSVSFLVLLVVVPPFAPFALFIAWLYIRLAPPYIRASRDLRRLESISLSPAFAGFDELLRGITHIRAYGMEQIYQENFYAKVDRFQNFDHVYWLVNGWLRWRYDCLGSVVVFATTLSALLMNINSGFTALVIVQAGVFAEASRQLVKVAAQLELDFNSVERVVEYLEVPQEAPAIIEKSRPPAYWPSNSGELEVENLSIKYAADLPSVLKDISFTVQPSEKIGVVGRTGSGKSTLALSLLRMVEPSSGRIIIDGIDISTIGLEDLRTRITIVSQDVALFAGTIRSNLDPLHEHTTEECVDVMKRCHLSAVLQGDVQVEQEGIGSILLDLPVNQGSLSGGERQLVALARAILRKTNIIIMDEATSQIDIALDDKIQRTIREELTGAIVVTIAHRLKTIMDYDRILVMDNGTILEFASPKDLISDPKSAFREMCRQSPDWPSFASLAGAGADK